MDRWTGRFALSEDTKGVITTIATFIAITGGALLLLLAELRD